MKEARALSSASEKQEREFFSHILYRPGFMKELEKIGKRVVFSRKQIITEPGELSCYCYIVKRGRVVSFEMYANGEERIYHFYEEGSLFLEDAVLFDRIYSFGFRAAGTVELIQIQKEALTEALNLYPHLMMELLHSWSDKFHSAMEQTRHTRSHSIRWRVCDLLFSFAEYNGVSYGNKVMIKEKISQQTIASMLGINRITAVRSIKELKELGYVEQVNGFYCINDMKKMIQYQKNIDKNI